MEYGHGKNKKEGNGGRVGEERGKGVGSGGRSSILRTSIQTDLRRGGVLSLNFSVTRSFYYFVYPCYH